MERKATDDFDSLVDVLTLAWRPIDDRFEVAKKRGRVLHFVDEQGGTVSREKFIRRVLGHPRVLGQVEAHHPLVGEERSPEGRLPRLPSTGQHQDLEMPSGRLQPCGYYPVELNVWPILDSIEDWTKVASRQR